MHMQLLHNDRVLIYDRTDFGLSNLTLPNRRCRHESSEKVVKTDCTAHSVEYDVTSNTFRALFVQTDLWCSSGSAIANGSLIQTGGYLGGERRVRIFNPCPTCDWEEIDGGIVVKRWYSTNHMLPNGRQIIIGGRQQFNYEFYPKTAADLGKTFVLPFLVQTFDAIDMDDNLYPFVFLNVDGNLFIFANHRAILFNYQKYQVVRTYPTIPGGDPRCYPSTGSAVLLPLKNLQAPSVEAEVLICGGAPKGSYEQAKEGTFIKGLDTCARIKITDPKSQWVMETMPGSRVMSDIVMLPNGNVLLINGAFEGTAGWNLGQNPVLSPFLYKTNGKVGSRFELQNPTTIPRMYHSTAILLRDGRVLVGGSNPHVGYNFTNVFFPTELRLESFSPSYLEPRFSNERPSIVDRAPQSQIKINYAQKLKVRFRVTGILAQDSVSVTMLAPPFTTHSFSMNQRLLIFEPNNLKAVGKSMYQVEVTTPPSAILAPRGFYLLFVVHHDIPSQGIWVQIM
ncbi:aldehyde oxidase GLOX1-like [Gastrolobium bilobum]|uniref:aldehyde oxidase GLOX1-like n=1 Tax=Gastrolobium bilobum TaxID=150636 RepID=UPI002AB127B5|nr:aldehyde oxidase GLOX1-like [Gastrolobium bilobum]